MSEIFLLCLLLGLAAGLIAGLLGLGGGVLIVPVLSWVFTAHHFAADTIMLMAVATSLATALFTSSASVVSHHKLGNIDWRTVARLAPGMLIGASVGALVAKQLAADYLRWFFVAYLSYISLKMAGAKHAAIEPMPRSLSLDLLVGHLIGLISSLLGIGGGTMTVPYLHRNGFSMKNAVAMSSACALPIALSGALSYGWLGWGGEQLPQGSFGYIYMPAFVGIVLCSMITASMGARLAHQLPSMQLKRYFSLILILIALKMAWQ